MEKLTQINNRTSRTNEPNDRMANELVGSVYVYANTVF